MAENLIVVGVDGSASSREALRWAAGQAELTGGSLRVVMAWFWPVVSGYAPPPPEMDLARDAEVVVDGLVADVLGDSPGAPVEKRVVEGAPAAVLVEASSEAALLVVGSRGHGAFAGMLLGSVSAHCVSHARCPVVVVRDRGHGGPSLGGTS